MSEYQVIDLPLDKIREYCASQPIARLSLFGSAARDELRPESDVDLLVEYLPDARVGYFTMAQHMLDFSDIIGRRIDLATPDSLSPYIRPSAMSSARVIYAQAQQSPSVDSV